MHTEIKQVWLWAALATAGCLNLAIAQPPPAGGPPGGGPPGPPSAGNANGPPMVLPPAGPGGKPMGPRPPDVVARGPSIDVAVDMAKAIVSACTGYHVGVSILDAAGTPKLYYVPDGTGGSHAYTGYRKAHSALVFKMPSGKVAAAAKADPAVAAKMAADKDNFIPWAGGMPIMAGTEVIGAVGVSGAEPSEKDEECAVAGIRAVQARLK